MTWGALTRAREELEGARVACLGADDATRADFCLGFGLGAGTSLRVAAGFCEGEDESELARGTG